MSLPPDHPALAVVAPPRLARFRELLQLGSEDEIAADFTGWSKLVLLTADRAVLFPRDHTQVEPLRREIVALEAVNRLDVPAVPRLHAVWEDPGLSAHPVVVLDRLPGIPLAAIVEHLPVDLLADLFAELGRARRPLARPRPRPRADPPPPRQRLPTTPPSRRSSSSMPDKPGPRPMRWPEPGSSNRSWCMVICTKASCSWTLSRPTALTGILDWQTARVDHPFVEFDLGEWGTALWRGHRAAFPELRRRAWDAYARERGLPDDLGPVFEWHHACAHARKRLGIDAFPVEHGPDIVGTRRRRP